MDLGLELENQTQPSLRRGRNNVLHKVAVSGKGSDERPHELIAKGFLSFHERARNLKDHNICVIRQNEILVHS